jgi:hypothetical protein
MSKRISLRLAVNGVAALAVSLLAAGCAYVQPYVKLYQDAVPAAPEVVAAMPQVTQSLRSLDTWAVAVENLHGKTGEQHRMLDLVTFGLTLGAAAAPIYKAHVDLITGLAIGAGATYLGNTLFVPMEQVQLYGAALRSLDCVHGRGNALRLSVAPEADVQTLASAYAKFRDSIPGTCSFAALDTAFIGAEDSLRRVLAVDFSAGQKLTAAGRNVVLTLNEELDRRAPSPAAIVAAAKSAVSLAVPAAAPTEDKAKAAAMMVGKQRAVEPCTPAHVVQLAQRTAYYVSRKAALDGALDSLGELDTACVFNVSPVSVLALSQESVVLAAGSVVNIVVSGGRPPYFANWSSEPGDVVSLARSAPNIVSVRAAKTIAADASFTLIVSDSSLSERSKTVAVATKKSQ